MWPRVVEAMLGFWMLASPFIFRQTPLAGEFTTSAFASGAVLLVTSLLSIWPPARSARGGTLLVAAWLAGHGYFAAERPGSPMAQNELVIGLTLLLFAVLPNDINDVPRPWRRTGPAATERG